MLVNLSEYYKKADGETKQKILCCIFEEKLVNENGRVATTPYHCTRSSFAQCQ